MMNASIPPSQPPDHRAQELRGFMRVIEEFSMATDSFFKRLYNNLGRRHKILVDPDDLRSAQGHLHNAQQRVKEQNLELARLTSALAVIDEGVIMLDPRSRIVLMNEAARHMTGGARYFWESPLGQLYRDASAQESVLPPNTQQMQPLGESQRIAVQDRLLAVRMARVFGSAGDFLGTVILLNDVTTDALADRLKNSFITQMSHELLTPLTSIKGMSDLLLNVPADKPPDRRFLEAIVRNTAIMDRMIVELLDLSEITEGSFTVRTDPLALHHQVFTVLQGMEASLIAADLKLTVLVFGKDQRIPGDARRLQWALGHLLDNAIKYTLPGGEIVIQITHSRQGQAIIKVTDTGVGIAEADMPHIFDRFYRGTARTPEGKVIDPRGLGQGLFVTRAVVRAHGGDVSVATTLGEGSTFSLRLPTITQAA